jgi:hypothetical protein
MWVWMIFWRWSRMMISCRWIAAEYCSGWFEFLVFNHLWIRCRRSEWLVLDFFMDGLLRGSVGLGLVGGWSYDSATLVTRCLEHFQILYWATMHFCLN